MSKISIALVSGLAVLAAGAATPALAAKSRAKTITVPASTFKDPASKLCMPRTITGAAEDSKSPTLCQTRDEWAALGVTIVLK